MAKAYPSHIGTAMRFTHTHGHGHVDDEGDLIEYYYGHNHEHHHDFNVGDHHHKVMGFKLGGNDG